MLLIPAIDLKDGACVRLKQGRMEDNTVFSNDPVKVAERWVNEGAERLHIVDLNGAFAGRPVNAEVVYKITQAFPDLKVQLGGGIRNKNTIQEYIDAGVNFAIIGTQAVKDPEFVKQMCQDFSGHIIVGLDAKEGFVATEGWADVSELQANELAMKFENVGVNEIIYTDIARDGMMRGVNVEATAKLAESINIPVIASGGITNIDDIKKLKEVESCGISGAITGRAIYEGTLDFSEARKLAL
jgi:phosphoribosylformimino-5-aminoimidazole carboxamide ribotide isomerase